MVTIHMIRVLHCCYIVVFHYRFGFQGVEAMAPFIPDRKVEISERDMITLLTEDRPFFHMFSQGMREQLFAIKGLYSANPSLLT